jgi:predicted dehydrogenase
VGVIGTGTIGRTHIRTWKAVGVTPVAYADANADALAATVAEHGGEGFADGLDLIRSGKIDLVSICTPPVFHRDLAIPALEAGVAVLCEKPMARTLEDAEAMHAAAERTGTLFTVGFCHRFQPHLEVLKAMIDNGELGTVMSYRNRFAGHKADAEKTWFANPAIAGGGVLADTSVHSIDMFRYLVGEPVAAHAFTSTRKTDLGPKLEVDDTAALLLQTAEGAIGVIESSWRTPGAEWSVAVYGTGGTVYVDYRKPTLTFAGPDRETREIEVPEGDRFEREFAHLLACWRGEVHPLTPLRHGGWNRHHASPAPTASPPTVSSTPPTAPPNAPSVWTRFPKKMLPAGSC